MTVRTHRGFELVCDIETEDDNRKRNWTVIAPDGEQIECPVGTYDHSGHEVRVWIDAGMPPHKPAKYVPLVSRLWHEVVWWVKSRREWRAYRRECVRRAGIVSRL